MSPARLSSPRNLPGWSPSFGSSRRVDTLPLTSLPCRDRCATALLCQPKQERERPIQVHERPNVAGISQGGALQTVEQAPFVEEAQVVDRRPLDQGLETRKVARQAYVVGLVEMALALPVQDAFGQN